VQFSWYVKDLGAYSGYINQSDDTQSYMCSSIRLLVLITPTLQLFITYLELLDTREERRAQLQRVYHFECMCQKCLTEESKVGHAMYSSNDTFKSNCLAPFLHCLVYRILPTA